MSSLKENKISEIDSGSTKISIEMSGSADIFDNLNGDFVSRLREVAATTRNTVDGKATITFKTARIEATYKPSVIEKIEAGRLLAIPNVMGVTSRNVYSVYEIADIYPMHYSMLTLDNSQPSIIRKEFMTLIQKQWEAASDSTWIEIIGAPTGYTMYTNGNSFLQAKFVRRNLTPLIGSEVYLLSREAIQKFICYTPPDDKNTENLTIGTLFGNADSKIPFTVNLEKLLHYHVGVFAFTGSGKSNLTSLVIKKATKSIPHAKFVIFDISAEYGISILDLLSSLPSRIVVTDEIPGQTNSAKASEYLKRHVCPEGLESSKQELLTMINRLIADNKIKLLDINADSNDATRWYTTYGGLLGSLEELVGEKYGVAAQKILVPTIVDMIRDFMKQNKLSEEDAIDEAFRTVLARINQIFAESNLAKNAALLNIFKNIEIVLDHAPSHREVEQRDEEFTASSLVNEILDTSNSSPRIFLIDLPEADMARRFCSDLINKVFRARRDSFNLTPKIVFIFDEAQEFIPYEKKKEDETETSSRAVERLLRHGRKYNLHGWISTQRIAHLNTNALQQLHSYFVSTMPRPYDRQLIADTFAIDDTFMDRTLSFENGDWLVTSFKATNTQSVPVFFHAYNNEDSILGK